VEAAAGGARRRARHLLVHRAATDGAGG